MNVLSLDTTTRAGSVAVVSNGRILREDHGDSRLTHGVRLPGALDRILETAGLGASDIDLLAVAAGPGSFTGLRVGIAAMQGLAMAISKPIVPVSALDALAIAAGPGIEPVAAWMDAQRGQVFAALFDPSGTRLLIEPSALAPGDTLAIWQEHGFTGPLRFIGDGARRYRVVIGSALGERARELPDAEGSGGDAPPLAGIIGQIAEAHPERAVLPHAVVPIYIRRPDAELARRRRGSGG